MSEKNLNSEKTVILGAGIGGLSIAFELLTQGRSVIIIEKSTHVGGLMRAVREGDFCVDLGQKQFYSRIPSVQAFFEKVMGQKWCEYPYRVGVLYKGKIYERDRRHRGMFRGMGPMRLGFATCDLLWQRLRYTLKPIKTLEDLAWSRKGRLFSHIFSQGFDEKLKCRKWKGVPIGLDVHPFFQRKTKAVDRGQSTQRVWYHPEKGSGGLIEALMNEITRMGGEIRLGTEVTQLEQSGGEIKSLVVKQEGRQETIRPERVVSSLRVEHLAKLLHIPVKVTPAEISFQRGVIIVYLFLNEAISFPHTCLQVTTPNHRFGRVTNYGAYQCGMVPPGKSCLAFELFCTKEDPLLQANTDTLVDLVNKEFGSAGWGNLRNTAAVQVYRLPLGDAATNWFDYRQDKTRLALYQEITKTKNLYNVSRTGVDKTIHAALMAAKSIQEGEKATFLDATRPELEEPWIKHSG